MEKAKVEVTCEYWIRDFDMINVATTALHMNIRCFGMTYDNRIEKHVSVIYSAQQGAGGTY